MLNDRELSAAIGSTAYDTDGDKIGTVEHFFVDDRTGAPTWVAVTTGLFGNRHSVVPALDAAFTEGSLRLQVQKAAVKAAPEVPDSAHLDAAVEDRLRRHYGVSTSGTDDHPRAEPSAGSAPSGTVSPAPSSDPTATGQQTGRHAARETDDEQRVAGSSTATGPVPVGAVGTAGSEPPGPVPVSEAEVAAARGPEPSDDGTMIRSEERLRVGTERGPVGRVRLVKYVVTEDVQVTVPIRREEVRLEEIPLDGAPEGSPDPGESLVPPGTGPAGGLPDEIVLHTERPVVHVEVVPVERVRVRTEVVSGEEQVSDRLQRERIVLDQS